jgi:hypothetical protein
MTCSNCCPTSKTQWEYAKGNQYEFAFGWSVKNGSLQVTPKYRSLPDGVWSEFTDISVTQKLAQKLWNMLGGQIIDTQNIRGAICNILHDLKNTNELDNLAQPQEI